MASRKANKRPNAVFHKHDTALLIIDMLNTLEFKEGRQLLKNALPIAKAIAQLKKRLKSQKVPVIYVNDNFGQWQSDWQSVFRTCRASLGGPLAELLEPEQDDYFVLKPKHSGFYSTTLDVLLNSLGTERLILSGIAGNICVLFTANDAYMRDYKIWVPRDCIASNTSADNQYALRQLRDVFGIDTRRAVKRRIRTRPRA